MRKQPSQTVVFAIILTFGLALLPASGALLAQSVAVTGDGTVNRCEGKRYTVTVTNNSGNALSGLVLTARLEHLTGFSYTAGSSLANRNGAGDAPLPDPAVSGAYAEGCGTPAAPYLTWDVDALRGEPTTLADGQTFALSFVLQTDCSAASGTLNVLCAGEIAGTPVCDATGSLSVQVLPGAAAVRMSPALISQEMGQNVTWTVTVENTGLGMIENAVVSHQLGAGLQFVSCTGGGTNAGQTTTWQPAGLAALASLAPGETVTMNLTAKVVAGSNLTATADVRWGCDLVTACSDTAASGGTATASARRVATLPRLAYTPPDIGFGYGDPSADFSFTISNTGDGTAFDVRLAADFGPLSVSDVSAGAAYDTVAKSFELAAPIAAGDSYTLGFRLNRADWCADAFPTGDVLWQPAYDDDVAQEYRAPVEKSAFLAPTGATGLSAGLTGLPGVVQIGDTAVCHASSAAAGALNCGSVGGSAGLVTVTATVPDGCSVVDGGGGTWVPGSGGTGGTLTWTYQPPAALERDFTLQFPLRAECETWCRQAFTCHLTAAATDCAGCLRSASSAQTATVECEEGVTSNKTVTPATVERCGEVTYTNDYAFDGGSTVLLNSLIFEDMAENGQGFVPGSLSVLLDGADITGCVLVTDNTGTGGGALGLDFSGCPGPALAGKSLVVSYRMTLTDRVLPAGSDTSFLSWSALNLGSTGSGCQADGIIHEATLVSVEAPAMTLDLSGPGPFVDTCQDQTVTLTLTQSSTTASPRDVRLVLSGQNYTVVNPAAATCSGNVSPVSCTPAVDGNGDCVWTFGDAFHGAGQSAAIQLAVRKRCTGGGDLSAAATFDDRCHDDATPDGTCLVTATPSPTLRSGDLLLEVTPETFAAAGNSAQWVVYLTNRGTGTAYNVWADFTLGAGLIFAGATVDDMTGVTVTAHQDHAGTAVNGATVAIAGLPPGERRAVTLQADVVGCTGLTLGAAASFGCVGSDCRTAVTDSATAQVQAPELVTTTSLAPAEVDACVGPTAYLTLRNAGQAAAYTLLATATLPAGLTYVSGSTRWRLNSGGWNGPHVDYDPSPTTSPLVWTKTQIPGLASLDPGSTLEIEFGLGSACAFRGGDLTLSTQYETPCGEVKNLTASTFAVAFREPDIALSVTRPDDPVGCGDTVTWTVYVTNNSGNTLPVVWVEDTLDAAYTYASSTGDPPYTDNGTNSGQVTTWELRNLPAGASAALTLTATVDSSPCSPDLHNTVNAWWGCGEVDGSSATKPGIDPPDNTACLAAPPVSASRAETRQPRFADLAVGLSPATIDSCNHSTEVTLTCTNTGPTDASSVDLVVSLPAGLTYEAGSSLLSIGPDGSGSPSIISDPTIVGNQLRFTDTASKLFNLADTLQASGGDDTLVLKFGVKSDCYATADIGYTLYFYDCCDDTQYTRAGSSTAAALYPALSVTLAPADAAGDCGALQSWTVTVNNAGSGTAAVVRLEVTPGDWITVAPGSSTAGLTDLGGGAWGWEFNGLTDGASRSFTLAGTLNPPGNDCTAALRQLNARAVWGCGSGGEAGDGNPTTTAYDCTYGTWAAAPTATLLLPDLQAVSLAPTFPCTGGVVSGSAVKVHLHNQGDGAATGPFTVKVTDGDGHSAEATFSGTLAAGGETDVSVDWTIPCSPCSASLAFSAEADSDHDVCECHEGNNALGPVTYTPTVADLALLEVDASGLALDGDTVSGSVAVTVRNDGCGTAAGIPVAVTVDGGCVTFEAGTIATLAPGATATVSLDGSGSVSGCAPCAAEVVATADPYGTVCECRKDNNARSVRLASPQRVYWADRGGNALGRALTDGSSPDALPWSDASPEAVLVDGTGGQVYWIEPDATPGEGLIRRANLDGTGKTTILNGLASPAALALDPAEGKIYWTEPTAIRRAAADGTGTETVISGLTGVAGLALDPVEKRLYFVQGDTVRSVRTDGTGAADVVDAGLSGPFGLALDRQNGRLYVSTPATGAIWRAATDGTGLATVYTAAAGAVGALALDVPGQTVYFETQGTGVEKVGCDGLGHATVVSGLHRSGGVSLYRRNTAPAATNTGGSLTFDQGAASADLADIVVTDPDLCDAITVTLTLSSPDIGALTAASGHGETYDAATGRWSITGPLSAVNAALAAVALQPAAGNAASGSLLVRLRDAAGAGPADGTITLGVVPTTTTALESSLNPSVYGQSVTFTATVTAGYGTPSGNLTFRDGTTVLSTVALSAFGTASCSTDQLAAGDHGITASYAGSGSHQASASETLTQTVARADSSTTLTSSPNPSVFGATVTLAATVTSGAGTPTGSVTFQDGAATLGTVALSGGTASLSTALLAGGTHSLQASYGGSVNHEASDATAVSHTVNPADTGTALSASPSPAVFGQSVTLTAAVTSAAGTPTGSVTFFDGTANLGTVALVGGAASLSTTALSGGLHSLTAVYGGSTNHQPSTSSALALTVGPAATTTGLSAAPTPSVFEQTVSLTAAVTSAAGTPGGAVAFFDGTVNLGTVPLSGGAATFSTSALKGGPHLLRAVYGGTADYASSASSALAHSVTAAATATALVSSVNPTAAGQATTFTATVSSAAGTPAGAVTFTDGAVPLWTGALSGGTVNFSIFTLAGGSHSLTATYSGSPDHQASTSPAVGQTVQEADTVARAVPSAAQACPGESVSFTVSVPPPASPMVPQPLLLVPPVADEAEEAESSGDEIAPTSSGDLNGDGAVDYRDYLCLCGWLAANDTRPLPAEADRNGDGRIDTRDLVLLGQEVNQLPRIVRYTVNPPLIAPGEEAVLSWEIEGADSARIEPEVGEVNSDGGTAAVRPSATTFYKLSAVNHMGTSRNSIRVRVGRTPTLTGQPASQTVCRGDWANLTVTADGTAPLHYAWYQGERGDTSTPVAGATDAPACQTPPLPAPARFWCRVSNAFGEADSQAAAVSVTDTGEVLSRQWYRGLPGDTSTPVGTDSDTMAAVLTASTAFWCRVTGSCGVQDSNAAMVRLRAVPSLAAQPQDATVPSGGTAVLTVTAEGAAPLAYQWYQGPAGDTGTPVGAGSRSFTTPPLSAGTSYWVRVSNGCGHVDSAAAAVAVSP